jgi:DNA repair protein RecO
VAYITYTTRAFVITAHDRGNADRSIHLFTEDAGALWARASGVRHEKSKMRYALQPFAFALVTLVRGKAEWRLVGAEPLSNPFLAAEHRLSRAQILRATRLVRRLVHGEEAHRPLFDILFEGLHVLARGEMADAPLVEEALTVRILHALGYVSPEAAFMPVVEARGVFDSLAALARVPEGEQLIDRHIERALEASQL